MGLIKHGGGEILPEPDEATWRSEPDPEPDPADQEGGVKPGQPAPVPDDDGDG
jgi:hypothetical protein